MVALAELVDIAVGGTCSMSCLQHGSLKPLKHGTISCFVLTTLSSAAFALVPDQDEEDEKLIKQAKANKSSRLASEKDTDTRYSVSAGANKNGDLGSIQRAVNRLGQSGAAISAGKLPLLTKTIK